MATELDTNSAPVLVNRGQIPTSAVLGCVCGTEADASTAVEVVAAPGAGKNLYVTSVVITTNDADAEPQLQSNNATPVIFFGPIHAAAAENVTFVKDFHNPVKIATNEAIDLKCAAAGDVSVWIEYYSG